MTTESDRPVLILPSTPAHVEAMEALQHLAYDTPDDISPDALRAEHFLSAIRIFPEGQFVAVDALTGQVVGLTSGMRIHFDPAHPIMQSWWELTGFGYLTTHVPDGEWMYGVESCVHPDYRGHGVGSKLMNARFDVVRRLNLRGLVAGSVIMDYHTVAHHMTPEAYVAEVAAGKRFDTNLSKQLHKGFRAHNLIPDYVTDPTSLGWGVSIIWDNPDYVEAILPTAS